MILFAVILVRILQQLVFVNLGYAGKMQRKLFFPYKQKDVL